MGQKQRLSVAVITRSSTWWDFKLPPVLFVFYLLLGTMEFDLFGTVRLLAVVVVVVASAASYGHVVNDISDVESDRVAGKQNAMADSSPTRRGAFLVLFGLTGFTPLLLARTEPISCLLLSTIYVSVTLYSIPPIRTKERGVLGPICDAAASHTLPTLLVLSLLGRAPWMSLGLYLSCALGALVWQFCFGLRAILRSVEISWTVR